MTDEWERNPRDAANLRSTRIRTRQDTNGVKLLKRANGEGLVAAVPWHVEIIRTVSKVFR